MKTTKKLFITTALCFGLFMVAAMGQEKAGRALTIEGQVVCSSC